MRSVFGGIYLRVGLCASGVLFGSIASAQTPIAPQGVNPPIQTLPPRQSVLPASGNSAQPSQSPALLAPGSVRNAAPLAPIQEERLLHFEPSSVELRRDGRHWKLVAGKLLLKDFGESHNDAFEARRLVSDLRFSEYGAIGTPEPVMEYWLTNGKAPPMTGMARTVIPFDPKKIHVEEDGGAYYVRDGRRVLFNFGPYVEDARQAVRVITKYQFNEIGFIGLPNPTMTYMLKNDVPRFQSASASDALTPDYAPQRMNRFPLEIPGLGMIGEHRPIDTMRIETKHLSDGWHLFSGAADLGSTGSSDYQARTAMQIAQRYPFTDFVRVGTGHFSFFLSNNQAPRGVPLGVRSIRFEPGSLAVKQAGADWLVTDGRQTVATVESANEAHLVLKVIQHYRFNTYCSIGPGMHYLAIDR
jgi:hypothetical protein